MPPHCACPTVLSSEFSQLNADDLTAYHADLATWKQHIFEPIKRCKGAHQLSELNLRAVHKLEKLQADWESGLADTCRECCDCLKCPPMLGCLLPTFTELAGHAGTDYISYMKTILPRSATSKHMFNILILVVPVNAGLPPSQIHIAGRACK